MVLLRGNLALFVAVALVLLPTAVAQRRRHRSLSRPPQVARADHPRVTFPNAGPDERHAALIEARRRLASRAVRGSTRHRQALSASLAANARDARQRRAAEAGGTYGVSELATPR